MTARTHRHPEISHLDALRAPEPIRSNAGQTYGRNTNNENGWAGQDAQRPIPFGGNEKSWKSPVCGLPWNRRTKYGLIALILVVLAAIGGGVGGALAARDNGSGSSSDSMQSNESTAAPSSRSTSISDAPAIVTSTIDRSSGPSPTGIFYRDCPSSNNSIYSVLQNGPDSLLYRKACEQSFRVIDSEVDVNARTSSLDECIKLCVEYNGLNTANISTRGVPCNSVCWRNGTPGDDFPFQCFGGYSANVTVGEFRYNNETICDSAAWINQMV